MDIFASLRNRVGFIAIALVFAAAPVLAQDHQHCFKIKDTAAVVAYSADLVPSDPAFATATGCQIKVPAKLLCIDVDKTNVSPIPPGAAPGRTAQKSLCYKVKCPRFAAFAYGALDQFGSRNVTVKKSGYLCAPIPEPGVSTTTSTTTTTTTPSGCLSAIDCPSLPNANMACVGGSCQIDSCLPSYADCNFVEADGCEIDLNSDPNNCNACGNVCPSVANSTTGCSDGGCVLTCDPGFGNCNDISADGCEVNLATATAHCGSCGVMCPAPPNATAQCSVSACGIGSCNPGFADCDSSPANGCEINTTADPSNCGGCGLVCSGGTPNCSAGTCVP